jgi:hypothetical protein
MKDRRSLTGTAWESDLQEAPVLEPLLVEPVDSPFLAPFDGSLSLDECPARPPPANDDEDFTREMLLQELQDHVASLAKIQKKLMSSNYSVLLVFQAMDAAGKDSTISAILSGVNPAGVQVSSFR